MDLLLKSMEDQNDAVFPFSAIIGQDMVKTALMVAMTEPRVHSVLIWGNPGTAKSSLAKSVYKIAPDIEARIGCPFHCAPKSKCPRCEKEGETSLERPPVDMLPPSLARASLDLLKDQNDVKNSFLATLNRGYLILDGVDSYDKKAVAEILELSRGKGKYSWNPVFTVIGTYDAGLSEPPEIVNQFDIFASTDIVDDLEGRIEITKRSMMHNGDANQFSLQFAREDATSAGRVRRAVGELEKTFLTKRAKEHLAKTASKQDVEMVQRVSKAIAALDGKKWASMEDIDEAWELVAGSRETLVGGIVRL